LDIGCGTGRFFHLFNNVALLTGIDVSKDMLAFANNPLPPGQLDINTLELIEASFFTHDFKDVKYDIIYSIGVLGEHVPFDETTAEKIYGLLSENGKAYFTIVDLEPRKNTKRKIAETLYPLLPKGIRQKLDARWEICYLTYDELDAIMKPQPFSSYKIERYTSEDPLWEGVHLECFASK
jgi:SAM-dependent methyltransferase